MPYNISWIQDMRIIHTQLLGHLTAEEAQEISITTSRFFDEGITPVHIIINVTALQSFPTNLRQNTSLADYLSHPNLGWTIVVGGNLLIKFILSVVGQALNFQSNKCATLQEALAFLKWQDATLTANR